MEGYTYLTGLGRFPPDGTYLTGMGTFSLSDVDSYGHLRGTCFSRVGHLQSNRRQKRPIHDVAGVYEYTKRNGWKKRRGMSDVPEDTPGIFALLGSAYTEDVIMNKNDIEFCKAHGFSVITGVLCGQGKLRINEPGKPPQKKEGYLVLGAQGITYKSSWFFGTYEVEW